MDVLGAYLVPNVTLNRVIAILTRNVHDRRDKELPVAEFLNKCRETEPFAKPDGRDPLFKALYHGPDA